MEMNISGWIFTERQADRQVDWYIHKKGEQIDS